MTYFPKVLILNFVINLFYKDVKNIQEHYQMIRGQFEHHSINIASLYSNQIVNNLLNLIELIYILFLFLHMPV